MLRHPFRGESQVTSHQMKLEGRVNGNLLFTNWGTKKIIFRYASFFCMPQLDNNDKNKKDYREAKNGIHVSFKKILDGTQGNYKKQKTAMFVPVPLSFSRSFSLFLPSFSCSLPKRRCIHRCVCFGKNAVSIAVSVLKKRKLSIGIFWKT